jgi:hypothetical protein
MVETAAQTALGREARAAWERIIISDVHTVMTKQLDEAARRPVLEQERDPFMVPG